MPSRFCCGGSPSDPLRPAATPTRSGQALAPRPAATPTMGLCTCSGLPAALLLAHPYLSNPNVSSVGEFRMNTWSIPLPGITKCAGTILNGGIVRMTMVAGAGANVDRGTYSDEDEDGLHLGLRMHAVRTCQVAPTRLYGLMRMTAFRCQFPVCLRQGNGR